MKSSYYYTPEIIDRIRRGYYSAIYFWRTKGILEKDKNFRSITMQIFQRHSAVFCGVDEVVELFKLGTGYWIGNRWVSLYNQLKISTLSDGDTLESLETAIHVEGPYHSFAHLESIYLGILARRTKIATAVKKIVTAARGKQVIFFADRFDHFLNQEGDGYAAHIGGAMGVATDAQGVWFGKKAVGTMPHALIASYDGNTVLASQKFHEYFPDVPLIILVDFHNDVVKTALEVCQKFGKKLWGVRVDTAYDLVDRSLVNSRLLHGVNPMLVKLLRKELDDAGFGYAKIVASGGFNEEKVKWFEKEQTPVDVYGVGSYLLQGENDFTADIVKVEGKSLSKTGRLYKANPRLKVVR